jgi:predicted N-acyltransferase
MYPELHVFRDISNVRPSDWNCLLDPEEIQMSHQFISACQESRIENAEYWHLVMCDSRGPCCVASLSRIHTSLDVLATGYTRTLLRCIRRLHKSFLQIPILFCGLPVSFGQPCLKIRQGADVPAVIGLLVATMEEVARRTGTGLLCFKEFDPKCAAGLDVLCRHGYFQVASLPSCTLPLRWRSFDEYVDSMRAGYRRQLKATLRARDIAGLEVRALDRFGAYGTTIFRLYEQVIDRAEHRLERLTPAFIEELDRQLTGRCRAILVERDGRPLAAAILLLAPAVTTFLLAGLDYASNRHYQVYPNLAIEVVAEAIRHGAARLEMGQTSYALKGRLGAQEVPRYLFLRHRSALTHRALRSVSGLLYPEEERRPRRVFAR